MADDPPTEPGRRERRSSDLPVDLSAERESFVRQFLKRGFEITEGLLEENKALQDQLSALQRDVARLRAQVASDDAIRDLLRKIETLEGERRELLDRSNELEDATRQTEDRNSEVEQELHDLANLYIASSHLHSTLSVRGVVRHLCELLQQLVGAEAFAIYLRTAPGDDFRAVAVDGPDEAPEIVPGEGVVGEVLMTGVQRVSEKVGRHDGTFANPVAALPLYVRDEVVGVIVIARVFEQKAVWAAVDHELFSLLGSHAATALIAANQFADAESAASALSGIVDHLTLPS